MVHCRSCNQEITKFFSLGDMPLVNSFLTKEKIVEEKKYELSTAFCQQCYLVQLTVTVDPEELFRDYIYFSSTSKTILEHNERTAQYLTERLKLGKENLVLEIASNDGALLQFFKKLGVQIQGVDPARNIAKVANEKGIPTIAEFFSHGFAQKFVAERNTKADLIYGANVLAHVPTIVDFVKGVKYLLNDKGTAIFEFPYMKGLLENKFDTIYHEHVFYYSLIALRNLFKQADLEIYDVEQVEMQGGSLRIFISHPGTFAITENINSLVKEELDNGYDKLQTYIEMNDRIEKLKQNLTDLLSKLKSEGKTIGGYSAPAKGIILLNYFGIGENYLDFIVDKSEAKQGLYTPGTHLMVHPLSRIYEKKTDYLLILCWNIHNEVVNMPEMEQFKKEGGKFIIPIPEVNVL